MRLAIDIGNTNSVFAFCHGREILTEYRIRSDGRMTGDEYYLMLSQFLEICDNQEAKIGEVSEIILSSTVPDAVFNIRQMAKRYFKVEPFVVGEVPEALDIEVDLDEGTAVGPDRLVNAIAGYEYFGGDLIIVDFGTATTFDLVGETGTYLGGAIAPGVILSMEALTKRAAALPRVNLNAPGSSIGKNTKDAMQSGIFWGYVAMINGVLDQMEAEYGRPVKRILTGGLAPLFAKDTKNLHAYDGDLTLKGLLKIADSL